MLWKRCRFDWIFENRLVASVWVWLASFKICKHLPKSTTHTFCQNDSVMYNQNIHICIGSNVTCQPSSKQCGPNESQSHRNEQCSVSMFNYYHKRIPRHVLLAHSKICAAFEIYTHQIHNGFRWHQHHLKSWWNVNCCTKSFGFECATMWLWFKVTSKCT